jgi:hypothetical protein
MTQFKLRPEMVTLEFAEQKVAIQKEYVSELDQNNCRDEVWESATRTLQMWEDEVAKLKVDKKYQLN